MNTVKPLRLSEAIRLGATMKPQAFGSYVDPAGNTCALGAAMMAAKCKESDFQLLEQDHRQPCPIVDCQAGSLRYFCTLGTLIAHLNDHHRWTRERIADFVELHEPEAMLPDLPSLDVMCEEVR